jgi:hypothetical protein
MNRLLAVAFILFCLEIGLFLVFVPWSDFWDANSLLSYVPFLRPMVLNNFFRGAVSGLGALDILFGVYELKLLLKSFRTPKRLTDV